MRSSVDAALQRIWYGRSPWFTACAWLLAPLSWIFASVALLRRWAYRSGALRAVRVSRPVIVVGNVTVGGTGKTPFVIWLAECLRARGLRPGIITRGYGGAAHIWPQRVTADSDAGQVGDEALLLALRTRAIVIAGPNRVDDARAAIELGADVILSDDGLQHYGLARDVEIAVLDGERGVGNGRYLPAGPLREGVSRLGRVDLLAITRRGGLQADAFVPQSATPCVEVRHRLGDAYSLVNGERRALAALQGRRVHAVAGIGHPQAFFDALRAAGLEVDGRALPDHAPIASNVLQFEDALDILMTEKDAVKCRALADRRCWAVELVVELPEADRVRLLSIVDQALRRD